MLRKLLKLVTMLTLLAGCYLGYVRAFTVVMSHLTAARKVDDIPFIVKDSKSKQEAILHARESFGPKHWTADDDLQLRYYNSERGFWMYSQHDDRVIEEDGVRYDGKRIKLRPAAIIWRAKDGSSTKTVTAEEAIIDLNQPLSFNAKPDAEPIVVKHARLERNVMIRDDRGTLNDRTDDLLIGPLTWVEFDDNKLQLNSDSDVLIVDRDTRITGSRDADPSPSQVGVWAAGRALGRFRGSPERTAQPECPRRFHRRQQDGNLARHGADQARRAGKGRGPGPGRFPASSEEWRDQGPGKP